MNRLSSNPFKRLKTSLKNNNIKKTSSKTNPQNKCINLERKVQNVKSNIINLSLIEEQFKRRIEKNQLLFRSGKYEYYQKIIY